MVEFKHIISTTNSAQASLAELGSSWKVVWPTPQSNGGCRHRDAVGARPGYHCVVCPARINSCGHRMERLRACFCLCPRLPPFSHSLCRSNPLCWLRPFSLSAMRSRRLCLARRTLSRRHTSCLRNGQGQTVPMAERQFSSRLA